MEVGVERERLTEEKRVYRLSMDVHTSLPPTQVPIVCPATCLFTCTALTHLSWRALAFGNCFVFLDRTHTLLCGICVGHSLFLAQALACSKEPEYSYAVISLEVRMAFPLPRGCCN